MIRVLVLADSAVVRTGLQAMLRSDRRFEPLPEHVALAGLSWLSVTSSSLHDVVLAEVEAKRLPSLASLPDGAGQLPLVLLVDDLNRSELLRAIRAGVRAVLPRVAEPTEIFAAIEAAFNGLTVFGPDELNLLLPVAGSAVEQNFVLEALSARELQVLTLMAEGLPNKNIADRLNISEHTVKFHVSSVLSKLSASSRTEAVTKGLKDGLVVI
jgi:two-component system, NarL family, response regulator YdfI